MPDPIIVTQDPDIAALPLDAALHRARTLSLAQLNMLLAGQDSTVAQAMRYGLDGGKGLRAFLVLESARLFGIDRTASVPAAAAIEAIHAYSLMHDDLPCMDDDDLRRGKPTVHRKWDETTAVLAGDALQSLAFQSLFFTDCADQSKVLLFGSLAEAAGIRGMVGGQEMDIAAETADTPLSLDQITQLQAGKTGALITWSSTAGAHIAGADAQALETYGDCLGLAFQIADDVLDVEGDAAKTGKAVGKDADAGKATFVSLLGLDEAKRRAANLVHAACDALSVYGDDAECLRDAARFVISREN